MSKILNNYFVHFNEQKASKDIKLYKKNNDFKTIKIIWELIIEIAENGVMGGEKGMPEKLRHDLKGWYSRRINDIDRLVYRINGNQIEILSCKGHYFENK